jgi:hypothetical protein
MRNMLLCVLLLMPLQAAAGAFQPPAGCTTKMTVQSKQCRVSNHYTCTGDAPGDQWRADFDQQGPFFLSKINSEAEWVESFDIGEVTVKQTLDGGAQDPASFSELLANGKDTFAFSLSRDNGEHTEVTGYDRLTGATKVIDGISLQQTEFEFTEVDAAGNILRQSRGNEYINKDWRQFFSGPSEWNGGDGEFLPMDGSPVQFIFPGEPGFAATQPLFDCDALMSRAAPSQEDLSHDHL